ncbi:MAG: OmpA family protein [Acidobacteriota bacterium]|nr:OmpA family protein [Acidobacteriota bacterium]
MIESRRSLLRHFILLVLFALLLTFMCCAKTTTNVNSNSGSAQANTTTETPSPVEPSGDPNTANREPSLVSVSAGAFIVKRPSEWADFESAFNLIDERPNMWATEKGVTTPQVIVIALPEKTLLKSVEFDNENVDGQFGGCSAKDISVEMSDTSENDGFQKIADVSLKDRVDNQRFSVSAEVPGRWVRLTVRNNHGSDAAIELAEFRAYGTQLTHTPLPDVSGTYDVYFTGLLHLKQQGTSVTGCYESRQGRVAGGIEGKVFKFTWYEKSGYTVHEIGPAIMVFSPDGKQMFSLWTGESRERLVLGTKKSNEVGSCPQWAGGIEEQLTKDLEEFGRTRVYGINFDSDSDHIKDESKPTLDKIVSMLKAKPDWKLTIEGHTDSTSTPEHNQQLSERRAQAVKKYIQTAGIDALRLTAVGYGATKAVASNDTELGRAQNRRVELTKQ